MATLAHGLWAPISDTHNLAVGPTLVRSKPNTVELAVNMRKRKTCEQLVPTLLRGNARPGRSVPCRFRAGAWRNDAERLSGVPTRERGNEYQVLFCFQLITNSTVLPLAASVTYAGRRQLEPG
jgi:hypothetical protein